MPCMWDVLVSLTLFVAFIALVAVLHSEQKAWPSRRAGQRVLILLTLLALGPIGLMTLNIGEATMHLGRTLILCGLLGVFLEVFGAMAWSASGLVLMALIWLEKWLPSYRLRWRDMGAGYRAIEWVTWWLAGLHLPTLGLWEGGSYSRHVLAAFSYSALGVLAYWTLPAVQTLMLIAFDVLDARAYESESTNPEPLAMLLYFSVAAVLAALAAVLSYEGKLLWGKGGGWRILAVVVYSVLIPIGCAALPVMLPFVCLTQPYQ